MKDIQELLAAVNWAEVADAIHQQGYALIPGMLEAAQCEELITAYDEPVLYRKTITMERYRFGLGEYKYFQYPLPPLIQHIRESVYPQLAHVANAWMKALNLPVVFPVTLAALHEQCAEHGQIKPAVLILKYRPGGYNTLHQDLYGNLFFPMQLVLFLNEPGEDYTGGEFVLTQQVPRAQSKAIVLKPKKGDMLIFTTNFRPVKGAKGYYRVSMKHGVSEVQQGERHTLGIIFHDALT